MHHLLILQVLLSCPGVLLEVCQHLLGTRGRSSRQMAKNTQEMRREKNIFFSHLPHDGIRQNVLYFRILHRLRLAKGPELNPKINK